MAGAKANPMRSAVLNSGPISCHRRYVEVGQHQWHRWQFAILSEGQSHSIGSTLFKEAWPTPCHRNHLFDGRWANSKPTVAQLEATVGHSGGHRQ